MLKVAGELFDSLANGPGIRYVLFTQGCSLQCPGCHNPHTWNKDLGELISVEHIINSIKSSPFIDGVTLSGGDPMEQPEAVLELCNAIKKECPELNILIYTGRTIEELRELEDVSINNILKTIDYLVDGRFIQDKKEGALLYTGSSNQRFITLKE